ncbi:hypothetical protein S245_014467, partial [Arachis hypogaea]
TKNARKRRWEIRSGKKKGNCYKNKLKNMRPIEVKRIWIQLFKGGFCHQSFK